MIEVGAYDAKRKFSELLRNVETGQEYVITNRGRAVARLTPIRADRKRPVTDVISEILAFQPSVDCSHFDTKQLLEEGRR